MCFFHTFEVILHKAEGEEVRTLDKKGDSVGMEKHLRKQSCQRR